MYVCMYVCIYIYMNLDYLSQVRGLVEPTQYKEQRNFFEFVFQHIEQRNKFEALRSVYLLELAPFEIPSSLAAILVLIEWS